MIPINWYISQSLRVSELCESGPNSRMCQLLLINLRTFSQIYWPEYSRPETYSELCQRPKMEHFAKIVNNFSR